MEEFSFQILYFWPSLQNSPTHESTLRFFPSLCFLADAGHRLCGLYFIFRHAASHAEKVINEAAGKEVGIIDLGIGFDIAKIQQQVADYGDAGRVYYRRTELTLDILYPLAYAAFFSLILSLLMRTLPLDSGLRRWNILPFIMLAFDYVEDVFIVMMLSNYPDWSDTTAMLCAVFRLLKWATFAGTVGVILVLVIRRFVKKVEAA